MTKILVTANKDVNGKGKSGLFYHVKAGGKVLANMQDLDMFNADLGVDSINEEAADASLMEQLPAKIRQKLEAAGIVTVEQVLLIDDLTEVEGIGEKSARVIMEAING